MDKMEYKASMLKKLKQEECEIDETYQKLRKIKNERQAVMEALHSYNDVKDATQIVLGQLADLNGVTVSKLHEQFGLPSEK